MAVALLGEARLDVVEAGVAQTEGLAALHGVTGLFEHDDERELLLALDGEGAGYGADLDVEGLEELVCLE
jgi:hypothetical protein